MATLVGVSIATIHRWEKGSARMGPDNMVALARALGWTNQRFNEFLDKVAAVEEVLDR